MQDRPPTTLDVVVGGQYGSESKGRVTLDVLRKRKAEGLDLVSIRVAGPNAGHVVIDPEGRRWAMRQLPVGFVEPDATLVIGAGSEIDAQVLEQEILWVEDAGYSVRNRLWIHPQATHLEPRHVQAEQQSNLTARLGSTAKGIGAARADRIWRSARLVCDSLERFEPLGVVADRLWPWASSRGQALVIEGTQGYGLGLHAGHYPQCTSSDARAIDFCAMAGVNPWDLDDVRRDFTVWVVIRPYPIRVAGNSGPLVGETDWADLGLEAERTTVTQKVRRVGTFDRDIVADAIRANGRANVRLALAMADQVAPALAGMSRPTDVADLPPNQALALRDLLDQVPDLDRLAQIGTGPDSHVWISGEHLGTALDAAVAAGAGADL